MIATKSIVHCILLAGSLTTAGRCSRSANKLIMSASSVAARRGRIPSRIPTPAARWPIPVTYAKPSRLGNHAGTMAVVGSEYTKCESPRTRQLAPNNIRDTRVPFGPVVRDRRDLSSGPVSEAKRVQPPIVITRFSATPSHAQTCVGAPAAIGPCRNNTQVRR